jgi:hypothetical protein
MIDIAEWAGVALLTGFAITIAWIVGRALWGAPEDGGSEWESAITPEMISAATWTREDVQRHGHLLAPSPVEVIRIAPRAVEHVGASEAAPALGAIGTMAATPSDDLLTYAEQVAGDADEWAGFTQALVDYEDAMLTRRTWDDGKRHAIESAQQRIDRWLSEGGDGVSAARSEVRQAVSETWDSPSRELALVDRPDAERVAEAALTA